MARLAAAVCVVMFAGASGQAYGDEAPNPTGTWKWTVMAGERMQEQTLNLKLDGDKLTGAFVGRNNRETPIEEASYKDGVVRFKITRERNDQKVTTVYEGKVSGDTITGKSQIQRDQARGRDWVAKRASS